MTWLLGLWQSFYKWLALAGAAILAIGAALLYGRSKGKEEAEQKTTAEREHDAAKAAETRNEIEDKVDRLPSSGPDVVPVRDAPPDSASGKLSTDWSRD